MVGAVRRFGIIVVLAALGPFAACLPEVGPCDPAGATTVVYLESDSAVLDGLPAFAGQAIVDRSCGGGAFCHSPTATTRFGAPGQYNFDTRIACTNFDPVNACDSPRLAMAQADVLAHAGRILQSVKQGTMPPAGVGDTVRAVSRRYRTGAAPGSPPLDEIDTAAGREILRNWLACDAPVIERTEAQAPERSPGEVCSGDPATTVGECRTRVGDGIGLPEPTWPSIYSAVIVPACVGCHGNDESVVSASNLDLGASRTLAHQALFRIRAMGNGPALTDPTLTCTDLGQLRIDTQSPADSLLLRKLGVEPPCGDRMPASGFTLSAEVIEVIETWIECGATLEPTDCP